MTGHLSFSLKQATIKQSLKKYLSRIWTLFSFLNKYKLFFSLLFRRCHNGFLIIGGVSHIGINHISGRVNDAFFFKRKSLVGLMHIHFRQKIMKVDIFI